MKCMKIRRNNYYQLKVIESANKPQFLLVWCMLVEFFNLFPYDGTYLRILLCAYRPNSCFETALDFSFSCLLVLKILEASMSPLGTLVFLT